MSRNLGTIFFPPDPKVYNNVDANTILMTKLDLYKDWITIFVDFIEA